MELIKITFQGIGISLITIIVLYVLFRLVSVAYFKSKEDYIRRVKEHGKKG